MSETDPKPGRTFHLGDILSVTTDRLVSPRGVAGAHELLDFMTSDILFTHQLPRAGDECKPEILRQHPDLAAVEPPESFTDEAHVWRWLVEQMETYGSSRELRPLAPADHTPIDPVSELHMMRPGAEVIVIEVPHA